MSRTLLVVVMVSILSHAQATPANRPTFAVASVKPHKSGDTRPGGSAYTPNGVTFVDRAAGFIIGEAYHFPLGRVSGPDSLTDKKLWGLLSETYDIVAKADHEVTQDEIRLMLQSLLAERFKLSLHVQTKVAPVYKLTVAKDGPRLQEAEGAGTFDILHSHDTVTFRGADMMRLSNYLTGRVDRVVIDGTDLRGTYNFTLKVPEDVLQESRQAAIKSDQIGPDTPGAKIFAESLKALGLQLVKDRGPVDYLVIDHVEKATGN